jgi:hypothetical protein
MSQDTQGVSNVRESSVVGSKVPFGDVRSPPNGDKSNPMSHRHKGMKIAANDPYFVEEGLSEAETLADKAVPRPYTICSQKAVRE